MLYVPFSLITLVLLTLRADTICRQSLVRCVLPNT